MPRRRRWGAWRRWGQIAFYVVGGLLTIALVAILIASVIDVGKPLIWGTFTQTDCTPQLRGACRPVGIWVSDDRTIVLHDVDLNGWTDDTGIAPAAYRPTALLGSDMVHAPAFSAAGPWATGVFLIGWVAYMLYKAGRWGDLSLPRRRRLRTRRETERRRRAPDAAGSLRREYRRSLDTR